MKRIMFAGLKFSDSLFPQQHVSNFDIKVLVDSTEGDQWGFLGSKQMGLLN